ncbi:MAG: DNA repair protein RadC [Pseudomonadota bacterium]
MAHSTCVLKESKNDNRTRGILSWPISERPRERLLTEGANALSAAELLAILIGHGTRGVSALDLAREILSDSGTRFSGPELVRRKGLGGAKAARILAGIELGKRLILANPKETRRLSNAAAVADFIRPRFLGLSVETFWVISVDVKNRPIGVHEIARGSGEGVTFEAREAFSEPLRAGANGIVVVHNHPSGDATPSREDEKLTVRLKEGAGLLGLRFLDHVIVTDRVHFSFTDSIPLV